MTWSLPALLEGLHKGIHNRLHTAREVAGHPVLKGDAAETVWLSLLGDYLPERYRARRAVVVDSNGAFSHQIDIVIFDRQYSPFVFHQDGLEVVPAESVYAVLEAKQVITAEEIAYAQDKGSECPGIASDEPAHPKCDRDRGPKGAASHPSRAGNP